MSLRTPMWGHFLLAFALALGATSPIWAQVDDDWPMVGGDPAHTGAADGPPPPYRTAWATEITDHGSVAGPVVVSGTVVVVGLRSVTALSSGTGEILWETPRDPGPAAPAAIAGKLAVYGEGRGDEAALVGASLDDGGQIWRLDTKSPVAGGATLVGGRVYAGARHGNVYALDVKTGEQVWERPFEAAGRVETPPAVAKGLVLIVAEGIRTGRATGYALDAETGEERWAFSPEGVAVGASAVTVGDDVAVFGLGDLRVRAVGLGTGRETWSGRSRVPFSARMVPAFVDDVFIGDRAGHLYRLDATSGEERWVFRVPGSLLTGSPAVVEGAVVVGDTSGQVAAIDLESGHLIWKQQISNEQVGGIGVADDRIFVSSANGSVVALAHDPRGMLLDEPSPTTLFVGEALRNFALAFVPLLLGLVALFRWVLRRRERQIPGDSPVEIES